ncbi:MAG TPA: glycosyltransferase family 9 protein, partial [Bdellovibrionales bacterium]|nr:glycosyltransferase family 9 protein [Bdellovibrionales bacterium]
MKILVLQLARFGDILTTWPVLRALKRAHPHASIDILVRHRFREACEGNSAIDRVWALDSDHLMEPLLTEAPSVEESLARLEAFLRPMTGEGYHTVLNLSFSPASAFLTRVFERHGAEARGYSRHEDGSLKLADAYSEYFYAQVGIGKPNRVHLADLLAGVAQTELTRDDWRAVTFDSIVPRIAVHIGASQEQKSYSPDRWAVALQEILKWWPHGITLIGSGGEQPRADRICELLDNARVVNAVGKTKFSEL